MTTLCPCFVYLWDFDSESLLSLHGSNRLKRAHPQTDINVPGKLGRPEEKNMATDIAKQLQKERQQERLKNARIRRQELTNPKPRFKTGARGN